MDCKHVQELILTDLIDGEIGESTKKSVEEHLRSCPACASFFSEAQKTVIEPFEASAVSQEVPEDIWLNIKNEINPAQKDYQEQSGFLEGLLSWLAGPRAAFAVLVVALLAALVVFSPYQADQAQDIQDPAGERLEYLMALMDQAGPDEADENGGYGTEIEEYFL